MTPDPQHHLKPHLLGATIWLKGEKMPTRQHPRRHLYAGIPVVMWLFLVSIVVANSSLAFGIGILFIELHVKRKSRLHNLKKTNSNGNNPVFLEMLKVILGKGEREARLIGVFSQCICRFYKSITSLLNKISKFKVLF